MLAVRRWLAGVAVALSLSCLGGVAHAQCKPIPDPAICPSTPEKFSIVAVSALYGGILGRFIAKGFGTFTGRTNDSLSDIITVATVGIGPVVPLILRDWLDPRRGMLQSISAGILLGVGEALALEFAFVPNASAPSHPDWKDWGGLLLGGSVGLGLGIVFNHATGPSHQFPSPGTSITRERYAAWIGSMGLFTGLLAGSITGALKPLLNPTQLWNSTDNHNVGITATIAGGVGMGLGALLAGVATEISAFRVYWLDVGWGSGMAIPGLVCFFEHCPTHHVFLSMAVGGAGGFLLALLATTGMPGPAGDGSPKVFLFGEEVVMAPYVSPLAERGFTAGLTGLF